jgi:uncharacterized phiE125 gp8 family phage protein
MRWREIETGVTVVTRPALEPISRAEAKRQLKVDRTIDDLELDGAIVAARQQVEKDTGRAIVDTVFSVTADRFPSERAIRLPRWPLKSVASITSYDDDNAASVMTSADYFVDTVMHRIALAAGKTWPSDLRAHNGLVVQFTAGAAGAAATVSGITRSGEVATATTSAAHGFSSGDRITIAGSDQADYNGTFLIAVSSTTVFTYTVLNSPTSPATATGTWSARALGVPATIHQALLLLLGHYYMNRSAVERVSPGESVQELPMGYAALIGGADRVYAVG